MAGSPPVDSLIGRQVRDLRIVELLGRGGMGAVYRAEHVLLHEPRAVKVIRKESLNLAHAVERFQREARIAVRLRHPNLVLVHDFFIEHGDYYLVMEYVVGESLGKLIRSSGPLTADVACQIGIRCCAGLAHAHELGVVHRDLSPENILLQPGHDGLEPKIIDFGIARSIFAQADGDEADLTLTRVGGFVGKPRYASPEQAGRLKRGERIDPRSDLYTFGLILYELVTGDLPFHSDSEIGYLSLHHSGLPARPSVLRPELGIPIALERVILRCLEKDRAKRFQTAGELARALAAVRAEAPGAETQQASTASSGTTFAWSAKTQSDAAKGASLRGAVPIMIAMSALVALFIACLVYIVLSHGHSPEGTPNAASPPAGVFPPEPPKVAAAPPPLPALPRATALVPPSPAAPAAVPSPAVPAASSPAPAAVPSPPASATSSPAPAVVTSAPAPAAPPPAPSAAPARPAKATPEPLVPPAGPAPTKLAAQKPASPAASSLRSVSSLPLLASGGAERYTLVNLHPEKTRLYDVNYQRSGFIPLCTRVHIDQQDPKVVRFTVVETGQRYEYVHHHVIPDFQANVDRVFGYSCVRGHAATLSSLDQQGIREGRVLPGMTKEGVILAIGYPPEHKTPSTASNDWRYWTGTLSTMVVQFEDGRVTNIRK
jgi:serine/threonine-protein kinase